LPRVEVKSWPPNPRRGACSIQERRDSVSVDTQLGIAHRASPGAHSVPSDTTHAPGRFTPDAPSSENTLQKKTPGGFEAAGGFLELGSLS
jgi:hypothetical protein